MSAQNVPLTRGLCDKVAKHAWRKDGEPDGVDPTEASRGTYRDEARTILQALVDLGYGITAPRQEQNADSVPCPCRGCGMAVRPVKHPVLGDAWADALGIVACDNPLLTGHEPEEQNDGSVP